jgi:hypothetical protein
VSTGHHHAGHNKPIDAEHSRELEMMLANPQFAAAVAAYRNEDDTFDIPYLGGSGTDGATVFYDRHFVAAIKAGQVKLNGQPIDPRKTLKVHESIEGAEIRLLKFDYTKAHDIATIAEHHAVDHLGWNWAAYSAALEPYIRTDERETITNPPPNLLLDAYRGTPLYGRLATFQLRRSYAQAQH